MSYSQGKRDAVKASEQLICCARNKESDGTQLMKDFEVLKTLSKGRYSKILLVKKIHDPSAEKMVLKAFRYEELHILDNFQRELSTNYTLSPHPNIVTSFNVSFMWEGSLIFAQEFAPFGDLRKYMKKTKGAGNGLKDEFCIKLIIKQIASALEFMHLSFQIVHGNIRPENILVFDPNFTQVKICDFGGAENEGNHVVRGDFENPAFLSPELSEILAGEKYYVSMASDAWQLGILLFYCVHGSTPWLTPDITDTNYLQYSDWLKRKSLRMPEAFKSFSPRLLRLMKRLLEPKPTKRYEVKEVFKYLKDDWLQKQPSMKIIRRKSSAAPSMMTAGGKDMEVDREKFQRPRSVSASPAITIRRASDASTSFSGNSNGGFEFNDEEEGRVRSKPVRAKSFKTVKFDIPSGSSPERKGSFQRSSSCAK